MAELDNTSTQADIEALIIANKNAAINAINNIKAHQTADGTDNTIFSNGVTRNAAYSALGDISSEAENAQVEEDEDDDEEEEIFDEEDEEEEEGDDDEEDEEDEEKE